MKKNAALIFVCLAFLCGFSGVASAQFKEKPFTQNYNDGKKEKSDSAQSLFTFREYFGGLAHKNDLKIGSMTAGSVLFIGGSQIYNRDYWKLPIIYTSIGGCAGFGGYKYHEYKVSQRAYDNFISERDAFLAENPGQTFEGTEPLVNTKAKQLGTAFLIGAGVAYWGTLMDGVVCYDKGNDPHPGRATLYSILLPGLGQIYNKEYWKLPIYYGGLLGSYHFYYTNNLNFKRYQRIYREATDNPSEYQGPYSAETAKYYRDVYRRYRDYSIIAIAAFYLLQVIDANIFAYMHDFEVSDDLVSCRLQPAVIPTDGCFAMSGRGNAYGMGFSLSF